MRKMGVLSLLPWAAGLLTANTATAVSDVEVLPRLPGPIPVATGGQASLVVGVRNKGPDPLPSVVLMTVGNFLDGPYVLSMPAQHGCGPLFLGSTGPNGIFRTTNFEVGPLGVGQLVNCQLLISRAATALGDTTVGWQTWDVAGDPTPADNRQLSYHAIGSLTDIGISSEQVAFRIEGNGIAVGTVRLNVRNYGPSDVDEFTVGSCADSVLPGFFANAQIPGGCGPATEPFVCFDFRFAAYRIPPLAAGNQYSCLVELTSRAPYTGPLQYPIYRNGSLFVPGTHKAYGRIDINAANDSAELWLRPLVAAAAPVAVPALGFLAIILLACVILLAALHGQRARRRRD